MLKTKMKKTLSLILGITSTLLLFNSVGCKPEKVEYYPEVVTETEDPAQNSEEEDNETESLVEEDENDELFKTYDSLGKEGTFRYDPTLLHPMYRDQVKSNPKIAKAVKRVLQAVHDGEETVEFPEDEVLTVAEQGLAENLLFISSPVMDCVFMEPVDGSNSAYAITYFPNYNEVGDDGKVLSSLSHEEAEERILEFEDYVTNTINENIKPENTDEEKAYIIYKVLLEDFEMIYPAAENGGMLSYYDSNDGLTEEMQQNFMDMIHNRRLHPVAMLQLYDFFMAQLGIDCTLVGARGRYQEQKIDSLDERMEGCMISVWAVIAVDENKAYNCDIIYDKYDYDEKKETYGDIEPDMIFFGMSDATRKKSFDVLGEQVLFSINPAYPMSIPVCTEDYKK